MIKRLEEENVRRESIIDKIEDYFGTLLSVPYNVIETNDLQRILDGLPRYERVESFGSPAAR